ncbi:MAG: HAD-IA family hydrolase [Clostridia bacterium]|nr:HAD-IA family hydrolase [Clostridia bacterium]
MKYRHYFWDFDGTLFDSYPHTLRCCWDVMEENGLTDGWDRESVLRWLLVTFGDMKREVGMPDGVYASFLERAHRMGEDEIEPRVVPFPDAKAVLSAILRNGGRNYLYTHRNKTALLYLESFGFTDLFTDVVTAEEGFPSKPAPDAVLALMERNGLDPETCIMVGDREIDGMSGKNAGIAGALVNYPPALPDGTSPAAVTAMDFTAESLTDFARIMEIPL